MRMATYTEDKASSPALVKVTVFSVTKTRMKFTLGIGRITNTMAKVV